MSTTVLMAKYRDTRLCACGAPAERLGREWADHDDVIRFEPEPIIMRYVSCRFGTREAKRDDAGAVQVSVKQSGTESVKSAWAVPHTHLCSRCGIMPFARTQAADKMPAECYYRPDLTPALREHVGSAIRTHDANRLGELLERYRAAMEPS